MPVPIQFFPHPPSAFRSPLPAFLILSAWVLTPWGETKLLSADQVSRSPVSVTVETSQGDRFSGEWLSLDAKSLHLQTPKGMRELNLEGLSSIEFPSSSGPTLPTRVTLQNGSQIVVSVVRLENETFELTPVGQPTIRLPVKQVRAIRFRPPNRGTDPTWLGWFEDAQRGDRLAVRRDARTLDSIDGTVTAISGQTVTFDLGGNVIEAPIEKLEGVLFAASTTPEPNWQTRIRDQAGSVWMAANLAFDADAQKLVFEVTAASNVAPGMQHSINLNQLQRIEFSSGRLELAEAEVASKSFVKSGLMNRWFAPKVHGQRVTMYAPGEITFRIPDDYTSFSSTVKRDSNVNQLVPLLIEVRLDDQTVWKEELTGRDALGVQLELGNARRMTLRASPVEPPPPVTIESEAVSPASVLGGTVIWSGGRLIK